MLFTTYIVPEGPPALGALLRVACWASITAAIITPAAIMTSY